MWLMMMVVMMMVTSRIRFEFYMRIVQRLVVIVFLPFHSARVE